MTGNELSGAAASGALAYGAAGMGIADDMTLCFIDDAFTQQCAVCGTAFRRSAWTFFSPEAEDRCPYCHARPEKEDARAVILS